MDDLRGKYRIPYQESEVFVGTNSAVLDRTFVVESLRREAPRDDDLNAARGAVNAVLISIAIWIAIGLAIFSLF
jgi:hypothetical protein